MLNFQNSLLNIKNCIGDKLQKAMLFQSFNSNPKVVNLLF